MPAAERDASQGEPPAMRAARAMIDAGYRPVPITPGKKKPIGEDWGLIRHHPEKWRNPAIGLGLILGDDGSGCGLIDLEIDDPDRAEPALRRIFPDGIPDTACFRSNRGEHFIFRFDSRIAKYGQTIIKGEQKDKTGKRVVINRYYVGLEFRFGTIDPAQPVQEQSVVPPTPRDDGSPRQWIDPDGEDVTPESVFADAERSFLPLPECAFADLDSYAHATAESVGLDEAPPTWDKEEVKTAILPHALELAKEWGLRVTGSRPTAKGFVECRAIDRNDAEPSCGFNPTTGVFTDRKTGVDLSLFQLGLALKVAPDFSSLVNMLGRRFGIKPASGRNSFKTGNSVPVQDGPKYGPPDPSEWMRPVERAEVRPVPFPLDVFPDDLRALCEQGSAVMHCPPDYFAATALGLAGGAIGRSVCLSVTTTWEVYPNLYVAIVGPPGSKKSPALKMMSRPFWAIEREMKKAHKEAMVEHRRRVKAGDDPGDPPARIHVLLDDSTREAFAQALANNPRGLCLFKDELTGWVAAMNAYRQGKGDDKQFWMSLNSNAAVKVNRKGSQEDFLIVPSFGAVVGGLTPGTLPMIRESQADDGWLDRLVFSFPEPTSRARRWGREQIDSRLLDGWSSAIERLWSRAMVKEDDRVRPHFVRLNSFAEAAWADWFNSHNAEQCDPSFPDFLVGPWSKLEGFTLRIALILSLLKQAYHPDAWSPPRHEDFAVDPAIPAPFPPEIDDRTIRDACRLSDYFKVHFRRARGELTRKGDGLTADARDVLRWIKERVREVGLEPFTGRDVLRIFRRFDDHERDAALDCLEANRFILRRSQPPRPPGQRGRDKSPLYDVSPFVVTWDRIPGFEGNHFEDGPKGNSFKTGNSVPVQSEYRPPSPKALTWLVCLLTLKPLPALRIFEASASEGFDRAEMEAAAASLGIERFDHDGVEHWKLITF